MRLHRGRYFLQTLPYMVEDDPADDQDDDSEGESEGTTAAIPADLSLQVFHFSLSQPFLTSQTFESTLLPNRIWSAGLGLSMGTFEMPIDFSLL